MKIIFLKELLLTIISGWTMKIWNYIVGYKPNFDENILNIMRKKCCRIFLQCISSVEETKKQWFFIQIILEILKRNRNFHCLCYIFKLPAKFCQLDFPHSWQFFSVDFYVINQKTEKTLANIHYMVKTYLIDKN